MPTDQNGNPLPPNHPLAKWRKNYENQEQPVAITIQQRMQRLSDQIRYFRNIERALRQSGQSDRADAKLGQIRNLEIQLEDLQKQARRAPVEIEQDADQD